MKRREFERTTPEAVGLRSEDIEWLLDELESGFTEMHGLMIMRHGKVCAEGWWAPYGPGVRHGLQSLSKTYAATAVGIACTEGLLHLDDKVIDIFPDEAPEKPSENLKKMTVRDVLCMGCGMDTMSPADEHWIRSFLATPVQHEPGTTYMYNSMGSTLLGAMVRKVTGLGLQDYLTPRLFDKIGIDAANLRWMTMPDGMEVGGGGLFATTEDNLRLMKLYLNGGVWNGVRLLSETFVHDATTERMDTWPAHAHTPYIYDNCVGYGYQIWMCRPEGSYRADGAFGQFSVVVPSLDLIVSINEAGFLGELMGHADLHLLKEGENHPIHGPQATLNALFDILVPQIHADVETLPVGRAAAMLKERLSRLAVPHPYPNGADFSAHDLDITLVPKEGKLSFGVLYSRRKQRIAYPGADKMRLRARDGKLEITWTEDGEQRALTADLQGARTAGELVYRYDREIITKTSSSAWWDEQGRLQMSVLWVESEAENRYMFTFDGDEVRVDKWFTFGTFKGLEKDECVYRRA